jgi:hypothetical protein
LNWTSLAKVAVVNIVLILFIYLVFQDLSSRNVYAEQLRFAPSTSYSIFSHVLTLTGKGTTLSSPPTLDWPQFLASVLVVFDAFSLIGFLRSRKKNAADASP